MDAIKEGMLATAKAAEAAARIGERLFGQNAPSVMNFSSQICTTRKQSERLIALGLKKETADCYWFYCDIAKEWKCTILSSTQVFKDYPTTVIPAWSLHRLIEMMPCDVEISGMWVYANRSYEFKEKNNVYDNLIDLLTSIIKEGYSKKEYLEQRK